MSLRPALAGASVLLAGCALVQKAAAPGDELVGCWRSQQMEVSFADRAPREQNSDCVIDYETASVRIRCRGGTGEIERAYASEIAGPDRLRLTPIGAESSPGVKPSELGYRVVDDTWLITTVFDPPSSSREKPERITTVSVRDPVGEGDGCRPRGDTGVRSSRLPVSSLALSVPEGWDPYLVDPVNDRRLGPAVGTSLFIGAFVPSDSNQAVAQRAILVLVLDDVRSGPAPVRPREFAAVRRRFSGELGPGRLTCDEADRACAVLKMPEGGIVYTELLNVRGRVAMVSSTTPFDDAKSADVVRGAVQTFVDQLRRENR